MQIRLLVNFDVKPENVEVFVGVMQGAKSALLEVPGCFAVEVLQSADNPQKVLLSEIWESREIHDLYAAKMAEGGAMTRLLPLLNGPPVESVFFIQ